MKKLKNVLVTLLSILMMLTLFVGCSDNSAEESDVLGYVSFSDGGGSRSLETENETLYGVEDLYWAYTAEKIRGNYTTGQSAVATSYNISTWEDDQVTDGKVAKSCNDGTTLLYLTPVKSGPAKGLKDVQVGPFSVGQWRIKLYGFKSYNALATNPDGSKGHFTDPVYKGTTGALPWIKSWKDETTRKADDIVSIDRRTDESTQPVKTLVFALDGDSTGTAELAFNPITMKVPEGQNFYGKNYGSLMSDVNPAVRVLVVDMKNLASGVPTLIAVSSTDIKFDNPELTTNILKAGELVTTANENDSLSEFNFVLEEGDYAVKRSASGSVNQLNVNQFDDGISSIAFITLYKDSYTVGQNPYTMTVPDDPAGTWKGRYEYTDSGKWVTNGDIPESLKTFLNWAGDKYIQPDGSVKATTGAAGEEALVQGYALVGNISAYQVGFTSGVRTILGGDLNDLFGAKGETEKPKFGTAVAKITWKTGAGTAAEPVDAFNPYAQKGTAIFDVDAVGKTFTLYDSVEKALYDYQTYYSTTDANNHVSADAPYVELLANIDTDDAVVFKGVKVNADGTESDVELTIEVPVHTGTHFVDGLTIPASTTTNVNAKLTLIPEYISGARTKGSYTFVHSEDNTVIKNFSFKDNATATEAAVWIYTDVENAGDTGLTLIVDTSACTVPVSVYHSGVANVVNINFLTFTPATDTDPAVGGYFLGTRTDSAAPDAAVTSIGTLNVIKGRVEIGGRATVNELVSAATTAGDVVLKARENAVVQSYGYGTVGTDGAITASKMYRTWNTTDNKSKEVFYRGDADTEAEKNGFKGVALDGSSSGVGMDKCYWLYGIESLPVKLPVFTDLTEWTAPTPAVAGTGIFRFMHWSSKTAPTSFTPDNVSNWGKRYEDKGNVIPGIHPETGAAAETITLYPQWAQPLGGRVFYLASTFNKDSYHFYGVADGSVNELTEWYTLASATTVDWDAVINALSGAYYYTSTEAAKVYVAYAKYPVSVVDDSSGTPVSVPVTSVTPIVTYYKDDTDAFMFTWDETTNEPTSATAKIKTVADSTTGSDVGKGRPNTDRVLSLGTTDSPATASLWTSVTATSGVQPVKSLFDTTITGDWFVGSSKEYDELKKIIPDKLAIWSIWTSEEDATVSYYTQVDDHGDPVTSITNPSGFVQVPYKGHAVYWNINTRSWDEAEKSTPKYFIPIRTLPVTETVTP